MTKSTTPRKVTLPLVVLALGILMAPVSAAAAPTAAMPSDFNGDGHADLAIGVPGENPGSKGAVNVLYGTAKGLTAADDQLWTQDSPGVKGTAKGWQGKSDRFGAALASGDFDRDGYADLAISAPQDRVGPSLGIGGAVNVLYGSADGLTAHGDQIWTRRDLPAPLGSALEFGRQLEAGDFDGDGYGDLAIGGLEDVGGTGYLSGTVAMLFGGPGGIASVGAQVLTHSVAGGSANDGNWRFGAWMAGGDLDGDGDSDLAVSAVDAAGVDAIAVLLGTPGGVDPVAAQWWNPDSPGLSSDPFTMEWFGGRVGVGDFDDDGLGDLALEVRLWSDADPPYVEAVRVLYGSPDGPSAAGSQLWHMDVAGMPPVGARGDGFGSAFASGDFDGDGADDLAIGAPGYRLGGAVMILRGSLDGLTAAGVQLWSQDSPGVSGTREPNESFGASLAAADFGLSDRDDLAIGVPREKFAGQPRAGRVTVLYGWPWPAGLRAHKSQAWSQETKGIRGSAGTDEFFGETLTP